MKNKKYFITLFIFMAVFSFYRFNSIAAAAQTQSGTPDTSASPETETEIQAEPALISTGGQLMEWLESHKSTGGAVKLTDDIVLEEYYCFILSGVNTTSIFIDADCYTITIAGEIEFWSSNHLTFSGQPDNNIFRIIEGGMLTLYGTKVEGGQYALWQEEGSGLILDNCQITGNVHYAKTPFVLYKNSTCVIVEKDETAKDILPAEIKCKVNYQGQVHHDEPVSVSWNLDGTEKQQEERLRFQMQGSFSDAASQEAPQCIVVYNDYPLTFTKTEANFNGNLYFFRGEYTKPEAQLPITVLSEYSFDGINWFVYEETTAVFTSDMFSIALTSEEWDTVNHPYLYIRLQWDDNGTSKFSNVLCYAADNLEDAKDLGGTRGGGISITETPDEPPEEPSQQPCIPSGTPSQAKDETDTVTYKAPKNILQIKSVLPIHNIDYETALENKKPVTNRVSTAADEENMDTASAEPANPENSTYPDVDEPVSVNARTDIPSYNANSPNASRLPKQTEASVAGLQRNMGIILVFLALTLLAGVIGFGLHTGIFQKVFRRIKK